MPDFGAKQKIWTSFAENSASNAGSYTFDYLQPPAGVPLLQFL
jgi:hypothetical protein